MGETATFCTGSAVSSGDLVVHRLTHVKGKTVTTKKASSMARGKRVQGAVRRPSAAGKCRCGQDLDICSRAHCPRCGSTLRND